MAKLQGKAKQGGEEFAFQSVLGRRSPGFLRIAVSALAAVVFFAYLFQQRPGRAKLHLERLRPRMRENLRIVDGDFIGNRRRIDVLQTRKTPNL